jgi:hypothetical protein
LIKFKALAPTQVAPAPSSRTTERKLPHGIASSSLPVSPTGSSSSSGSGSDSDNGRTNTTAANATAAAPVAVAVAVGGRPLYDANGARIRSATQPVVQRQERSLGILAQRFVMLLLTTKGELISLEDAVERSVLPQISPVAPCPTLLARACVCCCLLLLLLLLPCVVAGCPHKPPEATALYCRYCCFSSATCLDTVNKSLLWVRHF